MKVIEEEEARFYVVSEGDIARKIEGVVPIQFDEAFSEASKLNKTSQPPQVLYTNATQKELSRFASNGIRVIRIGE